jgi:hypothetical protein
MEETCAVSPGPRLFSCGFKPGNITMAMLAFVPLAAVIALPLLLRLVGFILGWYLRKKTDGRRSHIIELTRTDQKKFLKTQRQIKESIQDEEDWEKVEAYGESSGNGEKGGKEWDGIVGFFHPFWYVRNISIRLRALLTLPIATLAVVANVSSGQPFGRHKKDGRTRDVWSIPETMR